MARSGPTCPFAAAPVRPLAELLSSQQPPKTPRRRQRRLLLMGGRSVAQRQFAYSRTVIANAPYRICPYHRQSYSYEYRQDAIRLVVVVVNNNIPACSQFVRTTVLPSEL